MDNGGRAFPEYRPQQRVEGDGGYYITADAKYLPGMTLLDWFAGQAVLAVLANTEVTKGKVKRGGARVPQVTPDELSCTAYNIAEAMIAEKRRRG